MQWTKPEFEVIELAPKSPVTGITGRQLKLA